MFDDTHHIEMKRNQIHMSCNTNTQYKHAYIAQALSKSVQ